LVVVNPTSGTANRELVRDVLTRCDRHALGATIAEPASASGTTAAVALALAAANGGRAGEAESVAIVVVVGGDGTVRAVADGMARALGGRPGCGPEDTLEPNARSLLAAAPPLFVVPAGTGNSVYRCLWEDEPWEPALDAAIEALSSENARRMVDMAHMVELDAGMLLGASAGLLAEVVRISSSMKDTSGRERYQKAAVDAFRAHEPFSGRVTVDGRLLAEGELDLVAVGGAPHRGGTFEILPRSDLDDGLLDVCAIAAGDQGRLAELALLASRGEHLGKPGVAYGQGRTITIESTSGDPLDFEHDGDLAAAGRTATIEVLPRALPVAARLHWA
jgi:diacylglycerol kinase (ATP)